MSLKNDFEASGKDAQGYIRLIWEETTLSPWDFTKVIFARGLEKKVWADAKEIAIETIDEEKKIDEEKTISNDRKRLYKKNLTDFEKSTSLMDNFKQWMAYLLAYVPDNNLRRELLANFMTRILRGEQQNASRRNRNDAERLLSESADVWHDLLQKFIKMDEAV